MRARIARWAGLAMVVTVFAAGMTSSASADLSAYGKTAYTKTTGNASFWWHWKAVKGFNSNNTDNYNYFLCFKTWHNGVQEEFSDHTAGPGSPNCTYSVVTSAWTTTAPEGDARGQPYTSSTVLSDGHQYYMCITGAYYFGYYWKADAASPSFCPTTVIDRSKPVVTVDVNGTAQYTNNPTLNFHIHYTDAISPPWAANYRCIKIGSPCTGADTFNYDAACSALNQPYSDFRVRDFFCNGDASTQPDGPIYFCAASSDSAVPDNPSSTNQTPPSLNSGMSNISDFQCGYVILDRTPPVVTASANKTTVNVGDLVGFTGAATDATSGVPGAFDWNFGDNTAHGAGTNVTHSYTTAGTFVASTTISDGAGNPGTGNVTITVKAIPPPGSTPNPPPAGGTSTGGGSITPPPTTNSISQSAGGGGTQSASLPGLDVLAPKSFKLKKGATQLTLAFTAQGTGGLDVALVNGAKILAKGGANVTKAGTFGLKLKLPKKMKPGKYVIKVSWTPAGSTVAQTKTLNISFTSKKAKKASAPAPMSGVANIVGGAPYGAAAPTRSGTIRIR
jgi:hypothetical protein